MGKLFTYAGWLEGLSLLGLIGVGMPMKYWGGDPSIVKMLGMPHGVLFLIYIAMTFRMQEQEQWSQTVLLQSWVLSCVPFGTFFFDYKLRPKSDT